MRNLPCTYKSRHDAAADLIHIYAHTKYLFRIRVSNFKMLKPIQCSVHLLSTDSIIIL